MRPVRAFDAVITIVTDKPTRHDNLHIAAQDFEDLPNYFKQGTFILII